MSTELWQCRVAEVSPMQHSMPGALSQPPAFCDTSQPRIEHPGFRRFSHSAWNFGCSSPASAESLGSIWIYLIPINQTKPQFCGSILEVELPDPPNMSRGCEMWKLSPLTSAGSISLGHIQNHQLWGYWPSRSNDITVYNYIKWSCWQVITIESIYELW